MPDENPAYTITTGFYPEIAAGARKVKDKKGRGRVMQKYSKVKGFSPNSVQRQEMLSAKTLALGVVGGATGGGPGPGAMAATAILGMRGSGRAKNTPQFQPFGVNLGLRDKYTYIGGTEEYKLYGDQVWYMHAARKEGSLISDYLTNAGKSGPQFQNVFAKSKPKLVVEAVALAKRVFDQSWDVARIEQELEDAGEMAAEEIGFSVGEFKYMSVDRAIKEKHINVQYAESSKANNRDLVKLDAEGNIVASYDVTEQLITQVGQHGITEAPSPELVALIKQVDPKNKGQMNDLKQGVIKMFTKQATVYNEHIKHLKRTLTPKGTAQKRVTWDAMLKKAIGDEGKEAKARKASLADIAKHTRGMPSLDAFTNEWSAISEPVEIKEYHHMRTQDKAMEQTSLEHIAHMLGTLTEDMNETFRQTHKVKELEGGNSIYAVVPMKSHIGGKDNLLFQLDVIDDTYLTVGERATVAIEAKALEAAGDSARAVVHTQNNQYMVAKSSKSGGHRVRGMTHSAYQNNQRNKGLRPTTNVSIPAGDKLEKLLISLLEGVIPDLSKIEGMKGQLEASTMGLVMGQGGRATGKFSKTERNTMFWALPYIGVLQSEYASQNQ